MGNRAVIAIAKDKTGKSVEPYAIYLHWNGGPESVYSFLDYLAKRGSDRFPCDPSYGMARLCQVIGNYFGGMTSLGIVTVSPTRPETGNGDQGDNGLYVIGWPANGCGYSVLRRWRGYPGRWLTEQEIAFEIESAKRHDYHKEGGEHGSISQQIARANDQFFTQP